MQPVIIVEKIYEDVFTFSPSLSLKYYSGIKLLRYVLVIIKRKREERKIRKNVRRKKKCVPMIGKILVRLEIGISQI
jgi:hypothetical protein